MPFILIDIVDSSIISIQINTSRCALKKQWQGGYKIRNNKGPKIDPWGTHVWLQRVQIICFSKRHAGFFETSNVQTMKNFSHWIYNIVISSKECDGHLNQTLCENQLKYIELFYFHWWLWARNLSLEWVQTLLSVLDETHCKGYVYFGVPQNYDKHCTGT